MNDAIMLYNGLVVPFSDVSEDENFNPDDLHMLYFRYYEEDGIDRSGRVRRFKSGNTTYMAIFDSDSGHYAGYYSEEKFWIKNREDFNKNCSVVDNYLISLGNRFKERYVTILPYDDNMKVYFCIKWIDIFDNHLKLITTYTYGLYKDVNTNSNLESFPENVVIQNKPVNSKVDIYGKYVIDKKIKLPDGSLGYINTSVFYDIIKVFDEFMSDSQLIEYLKKVEVYDVFDMHLRLDERYNDYFGQVEIEYHNLYTEEYFNLLRLKIIEFRYWLLNYKGRYDKIDTNELAVYIVNIFPWQELYFLEYDIKIQLIEKILVDNNWIQGNWYYNLLDEEQALIRIIKSIGQIDYLEIDKFLDYLNKPSNFSNGVKMFLFLYNRINDGTFFDDDGNGNQGQFVKAIYLLWLESKYNLNHPDETIASNALNFYSYTPFNSQWQFKDDFISYPKVDGNASPMLINYESEKIMLWYIDNFVFRVYNDNYKMLANNPYAENANLENKILAFEDNNLYGTYDIFQPVAIKATDKTDTIIRMPVTPVPENANPEEYIENCMPIFYLMYADDVGDRSDVKETIGTAIDVALTFTGIGNLAKLRYIAKISFLRQAMKEALEGTLTLATRQILSRSIGVIISSIPDLIGAVNLIHSFSTDSCTNYLNTSYVPNPVPPESDPGYPAYKRCQAIEAFLFAFEICTISGSAIARRALKRKAEKLAPYFDDIIPSNNILEREAMDELADISGSMDSFYATYSSIGNKIDSLSTDPDLIKELKEQFMWDFQFKPNDIVAISNDVNLVDSWKKLKNLDVPERTVIDVLNDSDMVSRFDLFYNNNTLKLNLNALSRERRLEFLRVFGENTDPNILNRFEESPELVERWKNANGDGKFLAMNTPRTWVEKEVKELLISDINKYIPESPKLVPSESYIIQNYPQSGLPLKNVVETELLNVTSLESEKQVIAAFADKNANVLSDPFCNFTKVERKTEFIIWKNNQHPDNPLQPNIQEMMYFIRDNSHRLPVIDLHDIERAGTPGYHAEFRALNDLAYKKWGNNLIDQYVFDQWLKNDVLGYVRKIKEYNGNPCTQKCCVNCHFFSFFVTYIKFK